MKTFCITLSVAAALFSASAAVQAKASLVFSDFFVSEQMTESERQQFGDCTSIASSWNNQALERKGRGFLLLQYGNKAYREMRLLDAKGAYTRAAGCGSAEGARKAFRTSLELLEVDELDSAPAGDQSELWNLVWAVSCLDRKATVEELAAMTGQRVIDARRDFNKKRELFCADTAPARWSN